MKNKKKRKLPKILLILVIIGLLLWGCASLLEDEEYEDGDVSTEEQTVDGDIYAEIQTDDESTTETDSSENVSETEDVEEETIEETEEEPVEDLEENKVEYTRTSMQIKFSSTDVNGNSIDDSIFAENQVTLVNLWEPWCGPCQMEMPDLEQLYQENKDWGFMIIGVHADNDNLKSVLKETGVTYPIVNSTKVFNNILNTTGAYPTTVFVDSEGYIIEVNGEVYFVGYESYDEWKEKIDSLK